MHDGGRPLWDFVATAAAFPADEAAALVTRIAVHWLLEGSTPSWRERERIIADMLNAAGFLVDNRKPVLLDDARELNSDARRSTAGAPPRM